ncbi:hypothetical protein JG688_00015929 [Phytophthora aleatoria]|uniref:Uncharacterized protein n=1 Tax=Phytophthora aleatoria TaxID=2496075 RepID=A0A8J5I4V2_9STRA|nr:hypothetical protein JG688_00015929 [Phytophthora aleatoria]
MFLTLFTFGSPPHLFCSPSCPSGRAIHHSLRALHRVYRVIHVGIRALHLALRTRNNTFRALPRILVVFTSYFVRFTSPFAYWNDSSLVTASTLVTSTPIGSTIATTQRHPRRLVLDVIFLGLTRPDLNCNLTGTYCSRRLAICAEDQDNAAFNVADTGYHGLFLNTSHPPAEYQH